MTPARQKAIDLITAYLDGGDRLYDADVVALIRATDDDEVAAKIVDLHWLQWEFCDGSWSTTLTHIELMGD